MKTVEDLSVADVAASYPGAIDVFHDHQIDFCCGGEQSFQEACDRAGIDAQSVLTKIQLKESTGSIDFSKWSPGLLVDFIVEQHHSYVRESLPMLEELLAKLCEVHGTKHPELYQIQKRFVALAEELSQHLLKEEQILFPAIKKGEQNFPLASPIGVMMTEHEAAGDLIKEIRALTSNYTLPQDVCITYQVTYQKLQAFEKDLMQHIHLENNILFKKVI